MTAFDAGRRDGILLSGLVKSYGPVRAVQGVDLHIAPGETVAMLGPNGAGKSTTIDMILGLSTPDSGSVSLFGLKPADAVHQGLVAAMLQTGSLIRDLSVRELLVVMASLYPKPLAVDEVLEITGTTEFAQRRTHKLSGGQTQRVRFAVALVANPDLLVLDEPTAALDVEARRDFWAVMRGFAERGKTVVFATHYLEEADAYAERIVVMARGKVVADGATAEIKARVGNRTIRATVPGVQRADLEQLPGVVALDVRADAITLTCSDADAALHRLLRAYPDAHGIEVRGAGLEEAFMELTADPSEVAQ